MALDPNRPIIIKKIIKKGGHGHHGGAWKVAYADFVTAMMAFFLLLWLLNSTTQEQKEGISNYFAPTTISVSQSGAGGMLSGVALSELDTMRSSVMPQMNPATPQEGVEIDETKEESDRKGSSKDGDGISDQAVKEQSKQFEKVKEQLEQEMQQSPQMAELAKSLMLEITKDGLRIQLIDKTKKPLFKVGSADPLPIAAALLKKVSELIKKMPNKLAIAGHTDAMPYRGGFGGGYTNWELSADRANASRRLLAKFGVPERRVETVTGKAAQDPLVKGNINAPENRRISITLLYSNVVAAGKTGGSGVVPMTPKVQTPVAPVRDGLFND